jgi:predicted enzyme related to lactoylglutathione lyase
LTQKENPQQLSTQFVRVESIEDYKSKAKQLGASVVKDKQEIFEGYAVLEDPKKLDRDLARKVARYFPQRNIYNSKV